METEGKRTDSPNQRLLKWPAWPQELSCTIRAICADSEQIRTAKSTHHPHKIDDQHRECKTGGGAYFVFFLGSENSYTTPPKIPPDQEGLLWGWCVVGGPLQIRANIEILIAWYNDQISGVPLD